MCLGDRRAKLFCRVDTLQGLQECYASASPQKIKRKTVSDAVDYLQEAMRTTHLSIINKRHAQRPLDCMDEPLSVTHRAEKRSHESINLPEHWRSSETWLIPLQPPSDPQVLDWRD